MSVGALIVGIVVLLVVVLLVVVSSCGQHVEPPEEYTSPIYSRTVHQPLPISTDSLRKTEVETEEERKKKKRQASEEQERRQSHIADAVVDIDNVVLTSVLLNSINTPAVSVDNTYVPNPPIIERLDVYVAPPQAEYQDPVADRGYEVASHSHSSYDSSPSYSDHSSDSSYDSSGGDCGGCDCGGD